MLSMVKNLALVAQVRFASSVKRAFSNRLGFLGACQSNWLMISNLLSSPCLRMWICLLCQSICFGLGRWAVRVDSQLKSFQRGSVWLGAQLGANLSSLEKAAASMARFEGKGLLEPCQMCFHHNLRTAYSAMLLTCLS